MNQQFRMRAKFPEFKEALSGLSLDDPKVRRFNEFSRIFDRDAVNSRFGVELRADAKQGEELRLAGAIGDDAINLDLLTEPVLSRLSRISIRISGYSSAATYFFREVPGGPYHQSIVDCEGCRFSLGHQWSERFQDLGFATVLFSNDRIGELPLIIRPSLDRNDSYVESTVRAGGIGPAMAHAIRETGKLNIAKALVLLHPYYKGHNTSEEFEVKVLRFAYFLDQIGLKYGIEDVAGFALLFARMNSEYRATLRDIITDSRMLELAREEIKWISKYMAVLIETMPIDQLYFFNFELSPRNTLQERFDRVIELVRTYAKVNGLLKGEQTDSVLGLDTGETKGQ